MQDAAGERRRTGVPTTGMTPTLSVFRPRQPGQHVQNAAATDRTDDARKHRLTLRPAPSPRFHQPHRADDVSPRRKKKKKKKKKKKDIKAPLHCRAATSILHCPALSGGIPAIASHSQARRYFRSSELSPYMAPPLLSARCPSAANFHRDVLAP